MKKILRLASLALALLMVMSLMACGNSSSSGSTETSVAAAQSQTETTADTSKEKIKLKMLVLSADDIRKTIADKIEAGFAQALPNCTIEIERGGGGADYDNKIKTYNAVGDLPDVFWADTAANTEPLINANAVLDLTPYVTKDGFLDKYNPKPLPYKDKIYTLNAGCDEYFVPRLFYSKSLFEKYKVALPKTYDEFLAAAKVFNANGITPVTTFGKDGWAFVTYLFQQMVMAEDPQVLADLAANKTDFNNKAVVDAINKIGNMVKQGVFQQGMLSMEYGAAQDLFLKKKAAMWMQFSWDIPSLVAADTAGDIDFMPFPSNNPGVDLDKAIQIWGGPLNGYSVSAATSAPDEAVKLLEYSINTEAIYWTVDSKSAITYDCGEKLDVTAPLMKKHIDNYAAADKLVTFTNYSLNAKTMTAFTTAGSKVLTGNYSGEDFAKDIQSIYAEQFK